MKIINHRRFLRVLCDLCGQLHSTLFVDPANACPPSAGQVACGAAVSGQKRGEKECQPADVGKVVPFLPQNSWHRFLAGRPC
jgi:hypothetical protein